MEKKTTSRGLLGSTVGISLELGYIVAGKPRQLGPSSMSGLFFPAPPLRLAFIGLQLLAQHQHELVSSGQSLQRDRFTSFFS